MRKGRRKMAFLLLARVEMSGGKQGPGSKTVGIARAVPPAMRTAVSKDVIELTDHSLALLVALSKASIVAR
jgi:hypothetical protein